MKRLLLCLSLLTVFGFGSTAAYAQCDRNASSPIRCGFYDEGYQDGAADANSNRGNNYRRYQTKLSSQYEEFYRDGYDAGFRSVRPRDGGWGNPGRGGRSGTAAWSGRVDDRANLVIRGGSMRLDHVAGNTTLTNSLDMNGTLPRRNVTVRADRLAGRGDVSVIQQPSRSNDFTAIVQISDTRSGADNYRVEISWEPNSGNEPDEAYRTGSVRWRGRVDQNANIIISGGDVQSEDAAGTGLSNVTFDINGVLSRRSGAVTVRKRAGRGSVTVVQQPSRDNDFTAIIRVFDPGSGADNYELDINW